MLAQLGENGNSGQPAANSQQASNGAIMSSLEPDSTLALDLFAPIAVVHHSDVVAWFVHCSRPTVHRYQQSS